MTAIDRTCLEEELAARFAEGAVSSAERQEIEAHLARCDDCRSWVAALVVVGPEVGAGDPPPGDPLVGTIIGRYQLRERLGAGATGLVYRAYDPTLEREVAIKLVRELDVPGLRERLLREGRALARLRHPHVLPVYDAGVDGAELFFAVPLAVGGDLRRVDHGRDGRRPREWLAEIAALADGIAAIHRAGFVHRDIKPDNILRDESERLLIADLGLTGTAIPQDATAVPSPAVPSPVGTPRYMAPELAEGAPASPASDQYALCVTAVELVCGALPPALARGAAADAGEVRAALVRAGVSRAGQRVLLRGLAADPRQRFEDMQALADGLRAAGKSRRRGPAVAAAGLGLVGAVLAGWLARGESPGEGACATVERRAAQVWDQARRQRLAAGLAASDDPGTWTSLTSRIDAELASWQDLARDSCRADSAEPRILAQRACLEERLRALDAVLGLVESTEGISLHRASQAIAGLRPAASCTEATVAGAPPVPPSLAAEVGALRDRLAEARAAGTLAEYGRAFELIEEVQARAAELDHAPLIAETSYWAGALAVERGDPGAAVDDFERAIAEAERGGHDAVRARATAAQLVRPELDDETGDALVSRAQAILARFPDDAELASEVHQRIGVFYAQRGRLELAQRAFDHALIEARRSFGEAHTKTANLLMNLGTVSYLSGDFETARAQHARSLEIYRDALGEEHPQIARALGSLAATAAPDDAIAMLEEALSIFRAVTGPASDDYLHAVTNLCVTLDDGDRHEQALVRCAEAVEAVEAVHGQTHPRMVWPLLALGRAQANAEAYREAVVTLERALVLTEPAGNVLEQADVQYYLAASLARLGKPETFPRALSLARSAREVWAETPLRAPVVAGADELIAALAGVVEKTGR